MKQSSNNLRNLLLAALAVLALSFGFTSAIGEESQPDNKNEDGEFIPTEEISEDYAVAFPVDI